MRKALILLSILVTVSLAQSEEKSHMAEDHAIQKLLKEESLIEKVPVTRVIRQSREARQTREGTRHLRHLARSMRADRQKRFVSTATRTSRTLRYVALAERKYLAKLK